MEEYRKKNPIQEDNISNPVGTESISEAVSNMQEDLDDFKKPLTETKVEPTSDTDDSAVGEITRLEGAGLLRPDQITNLGPPNFETSTLMVCLNSDPTKPYFPWDAYGNLKTAVGRQPNQNFDQK